MTSSKALRTGALTALVGLAGAFGPDLPAAEITSPPAADRLSAIELARRGDPVAGKRKSEVERCQECHGAQGYGQDGGTGGGESRAPRIGGQHAAYLIKQFRNFRAGERRDHTMEMMSSGVADADLADIVAYFSSQPWQRGDGRTDAHLGRNLYHEGIPARGVTACVACHGDNGRGGIAGETVYPSIAGQTWHYLEKQLLDFHSGQRSNSPGGVMTGVARGLTEAEIKALASYLAEQ